MRDVTKLEAAGLALQGLMILGMLLFYGFGGIVAVAMLAVPFYALVQSIQSRRRLLDAQGSGHSIGGGEPGETQGRTAAGVGGLGANPRSEYEQLAREAGEALFSWWRNRRGGRGAP